MNVQDSIWKRVDQGRTNQSHEAGKADHVNATFAERRQEREIVIVTSRPSPVRQAESLNTRGPSPIESCRICAIGNDYGDRGMEPAV